MERKLNIITGPFHRQTARCAKCGAKVVFHSTSAQRAQRAVICNDCEEWPEEEEEREPERS